MLPPLANESTFNNYPNQLVNVQNANYQPYPNNNINYQMNPNFYQNVDPNFNSQIDPRIIDPRLYTNVYSGK
jgi:hypothetical protein